MAKLKTDEIRAALRPLVDEWFPSDILEALAAEMARCKRAETNKEAWGRSRAMVLKAAVVARDVGL